MANVADCAGEDVQLEPPNLIKEHPKKKPFDVSISQNKDRNDTYSHSELEGTAIDMLALKTPLLDTKGTQEHMLLSHLQSGALIKTKWSVTMSK